eukprot:COSAG04_NODE_12328_length_658_cov_0.966011_1_plen_191_part_10
MGAPHRRLERVASHVVAQKSASPQTPTLDAGGWRLAERPPMRPGAHDLVGHPTVVPDLSHGAILSDDEATAAALALPNRGAIQTGPDGRLDPAWRDSCMAAFERYGFYVLEGALHGAELTELQEDINRMIRKAGGEEIGPHPRGESEQPPWWDDVAGGFAAPLGKDADIGGRNPVPMASYEAPPDAPEKVL